MQKNSALALISLLSLILQTPCGAAADGGSTAADMARAIKPIAPALEKNAGPQNGAATEPAQANSQTNPQPSPQTSSQPSPQISNAPAQSWTEQDTKTEAAPPAPESSTAKDPGDGSATAGGDATTGNTTSTAAGAAPALKTGTSETILKGNVTQDTSKSPLLEGSLQAIPAHTELSFVSNCNINSNVTQKGDEVWVTIGKDTADGKGTVVCPGGWQAHGVVTESQRNKRHSTDGYLTIKFDKIVSPDKKTEVPFETTFSTKDSMLKSVAKVAAVDAKYVTVGAIGGSIISTQMTGIPVAIATHGISTGIGAGIGAVIGAFGAAKRFGDIADVRPGMIFSLETADPIVMPGFKKDLLPSAQIHPQLAHFDLQIDNVRFAKNRLGDKSTKVLTMDVVMSNQTDRPFTFADLAVVSDFNKITFQPPDVQFQTRLHTVDPKSFSHDEVSFIVDGKDHKYWLVLLDHVNHAELSRFPIN